MREKPAPETFRAPSAPEPEVYVPMWPDDTPKGEKFLNDVERRLVERSKRLREEWNAPQAREWRKNNGDAV